MLLKLLLISFSLVHFVQTQSRCPDFGQLNYTCYAPDYCNINANLTCGDGTCGHRCPSGWNMFLNKTCYYVSNETQSYDDATRYCQSNNANLIMINNRDKFDIFYEWVNNDSSITYWVSGELVEYGVFQLPDGTLITNNLTWYQANFNFGTGFARLLGISDRYTFNDLSAIMVVAYKFVCEMPIYPCVDQTCQCRDGYYLSSNGCILYKSSNEECLLSSDCIPNSDLICTNRTCLCKNGTKWYATERKCLKCPIGWINRNSACFLITNVKRTFQGSNNVCTRHNTSLVKLTNTREFNETLSLYNEYLSANNSFIWIDELEMDGDVCFNLAPTSTFPSQSQWCSDSMTAYILTSCPVLSISKCISFLNCNDTYPAICKAEEFIGSS